MLLCIEPLDWVALETIGMPEFRFSPECLSNRNLRRRLGCEPKCPAVVKASFAGARHSLLIAR